MKLLITFQVFTCLIFSFCTLQVHSQVTIGSNSVPVGGSLLDVKENSNVGTNSTKGIIFPRVALEQIGSLSPCVRPEDLVAGDESTHTGMLVYNITDNPIEGLCPGLYVWDGSGWIRVQEDCAYPIDSELLNSPNCYIVSPGTTSEDIPVGKPYLLWKMRPDLGELSLSDKVSVHLLWQDTQGLITDVALVDGDKGGFSKFNVQAAASKTGNALVAVRIGSNGDETDPIRWSWHIWVTGYNPDTNTNGTTYAHDNGDNKTYTFMDRNLGATIIDYEDPNSMGLMYQWGRKDPFTANERFGDNQGIRPLYNKDGTLLIELNEIDNGGVSGSGIKHVEVAAGTTSNLNNSIQNPMTFYYGEYKYANSRMAPFDWFTSDDTGAGSDDELWGASGSKSPFDPCPKGWRVPAYSSGNKSPWNHFLDSWSGFPSLQLVGSGDGTGIVFGDYPSSNVVGLGFYPYNFERIPREFSKPGSVGSNPGHVTGGLFPYVSSNDIYGHYWTANAESGTPNAKGMYINFSPFESVAIADLETPSRAYGAFVRCVKE